MSAYAIEEARETWEAIAAQDPPAVTPAAGRQMLARYRGTCCGCGRGFARGDVIAYDRTAPPGGRTRALRCCP